MMATELKRRSWFEKEGQSEQDFSAIHLINIRPFQCVFFPRSPQIYRTPAEEKKRKRSQHDIIRWCGKFIDEKDHLLKNVRHEWNRNGRQHKRETIKTKWILISKMLFTGAQFQQFRKKRFHIFQYCSVQFWWKRYEVFAVPFYLDSFLCVLKLVFQTTDIFLQQMSCFLFPRKTYS